MDLPGLLASPRREDVDRLARRGGGIVPILDARAVRPDVEGQLLTGRRLGCAIRKLIPYVIQVCLGADRAHRHSVTSIGPEHSALLRQDFVRCELLYRLRTNVVVLVPEPACSLLVPVAFRLSGDGRSEPSDAVGDRLDAESDIISGEATLCRAR